ncbi:alkaline phosphatase family protein [Streptomyces violascens]|uniref:alkaline phosphatase family protein n=1 Tax=Streptomyces violascens TaxID=67381 RepID=UPI0037B7A09C
MHLLPPRPRFRRTPLVVLSTTLLSFVGLSAATASAAPQAGPEASRPVATTVAPAVSGNLLADQGGESAALCSPSGLDGMTVPGWTITGGEPDVVCYGAASGFPTTGTPGPPTRGKGFFAGGATGNSGLNQNVDVSSAASAIDTGQVVYHLSGWLGGYASQNDRVALSGTFLDGSGHTLGTTTLGPVTSTDRGNTTKLLNKTGSGTLPTRTRTIKVALTFTWSGGSTTDGYADDLSLTLSTRVPAPVLTPPPSTVPRYDHVFVVYMENENYKDIIGNTAQAPYINQLAHANTVLTQSYATTHPSDPNYVALAAGGLYGLTGNSIGTTTIDAPHLGNRVEAAGKTWKSYVQNMPGNCYTKDSGNYQPDDTPFYYFKDMKTDSAYCQAHWQPQTSMDADLKSASTTPDFVWFAADGCNDMEGCGITAGDNYLKNTLPAIFNSPAWTRQRSLLILTWDEGATKAFGPHYPNHVPTLLIGSQNSVKTGYTSSKRTDQYGLLRTIDQSLGLAPLTNNDRYAATVNDAWRSSPESTDQSREQAVEKPSARFCAPYEVPLEALSWVEPGESPAARGWRSGVFWLRSRISIDHEDGSDRTGSLVG